MELSIAFTSRNNFSIEVCSAETRLDLRRFRRDRREAPGGISSSLSIRLGLHHATSVALKIIKER